MLNVMQPQECLICNRKDCEQQTPNDIHFCHSGIAYYKNEEGHILKKREAVNKVDLATNIRHELSPILQFIISQADKLNGTVSTKTIDKTDPCSRIVGATVIIDQLIKMLSGVYHFHPATALNLDHSHFRIIDEVCKHLEIYSLIKNHRRAKDLNFTLEIDSHISVHFNSSIIEYIIAILSDNLWKYADSSHPVKIVAQTVNNKLIDLSFQNYGRRVPDPAQVFELGYQLDRSSEGFGYGLSWAKVLCHHYVERFDQLGEESYFDIEHEQTETDVGSDETVYHAFHIRNIVVE